MPSVQRTFELVPNSLARPVARPPMTSKAAKKAYQKAQNGPKVTRAEQRRRDAEVLERLRKENEKERAAAKAKVAREKKAAKAADEKSERRRMGVPEPRKGVRASQPTISLFVRGGNSVGFTNEKRGWRDVGSLEDGNDMKDMAEPPTKKVAIENHPEPKNKKQDMPVRFAEDTSVQKENAVQISTRRNMSLDYKRMDDVTAKDPVKPIKPEKLAESEPDSEDEFGEFPSLTQIDILEKLDSSTCRFTEMPPPPVSSKRSFGTEPKIHIYKTLPRSPEKDNEVDEDIFVDDMASTQRFMDVLSIPSQKEVVLDVEKLDSVASVTYSTPTIPNTIGSNIVPDVDEFDDDMASTQFFTEAIAVVSRIERRETTLVTIKTEARRLPRNDSSCSGSEDSIATKQCVTPNTVVFPRRSVLGERSINMPPPRLPLNGHKPTMLTSPVSKSRLIPHASRLATPANSPFTPKPNFAVGSKRFIHMTPQPQRPRFLPENKRRENKYKRDSAPSATQAFLKNNLEDFFPSLTQEQRELDEIMDDADSLPSNTQIARDISPPKPGMQPRPIPHDEFQLPSTQDFVISSQDLCDINTPKPSPVEIPRVPRAPLVPQPSLGEKRRFFKEKDDDLRQAGLLVTAKTTNPIPHEPTSRSQAVSLSPETLSIQAAIAESRELADIRRLANIIFEDDILEDTEALEAALTESKRLADLEAQQLEQELESRRFFQEKEDDLVEAALWASKNSGAKESHVVIQGQAPGVPLPLTGVQNSEKKKRALQRVESVGTDYGDDEFISSQEFLAFCDGVNA